MSSQLRGETIQHRPVQVADKEIYVKHPAFISPRSSKIIDYCLKCRAGYVLSQLSAGLSSGIYLIVELLIPTRVDMRQKHNLTLPIA